VDVGIDEPFVIKCNVYISITKYNEKCCIIVEGVCQGISWCIRDMVRGTSNSWDDPYHTSTLLDLNFSNLDNLITIQASSWEVFLKSQWGDE